MLALKGNGKLDSSFGINGELTMSPVGNEAGEAIKISSDGGLLLGATGVYLYDSTKYIDHDILLIKFLPTTTSTITLPQPDNKFILVYPTPLYDHATIQFNSAKAETVNFALFNEEGKEMNAWNNMKVQPGQNSVTLSFNNSLSNGWYTLRLAGDDFSESVRIIKQ
jgi:hypothetical protein